MQQITTISQSASHHSINHLICKTMLLIKNVTYMGN